MTISIYFNRRWHAVLPRFRGKKTKKTQQKTPHNSTQKKNPHTSWLGHQLFSPFSSLRESLPNPLGSTLSRPTHGLSQSPSRGSDPLKCYYAEEEKKLTTVSLVPGLVGFLLTFLLCTSVGFVFPVSGSIQNKAKWSNSGASCLNSNRMQGPPLSNCNKYFYMHALSTVSLGTHSSERSFFVK